MATEPAVFFERLTGPPRPKQRRGFTLSELMVVISIIMFLATAMVASMYGAAESAKRMRTQQTVGKIDALLMPRWESYMTRRLPMNALAGQARVQFATNKLWAMRELLRMDFPDRYNDMQFVPRFLLARNSSGNSTPYYSDLSRLYQRMVVQWTGRPLASGAATIQQTNQAAECLYLGIIANSQDSSLAGNSFTPNEVGDSDGDSMPEFLDAWGNSIQFLRWAPGFSSDMQPTFSISPSSPSGSLYPKNLPQDPNTPGNFLTHFPLSSNTYSASTGSSGSGGSSVNSITQLAMPNYHDAFDPLEIDPRLTMGTSTPVPERGYNLIPLIVSAGPDGTAGQTNYTSTQTSDVLGSSFGLHGGQTVIKAAGSSNPVNTDDDPYMQYSSPDGVGQTQRGAVDLTTGAASYDNIHNQLLRTRP